MYADNDKFGGFIDNAGLEEAQAGIKIAGRNISNLRYAEDTTQICHYQHTWTKHNVSNIMIGNNHKCLFLKMC